jgi:hypothetical protein
MKAGETGVDRVERALRGAYWELERAGEAPSNAAVERIMMRVRAHARTLREDFPAQAQFVWRFLSACAVATAVLVAVAITNVPDETLNAPSDDVVATVLNPTMPF